MAERRRPSPKEDRDRHTISPSSVNRYLARVRQEFAPTLRSLIDSAQGDRPFTNHVEELFRDATFAPVGSSILSYGWRALDEILSETSLQTPMSRQQLKSYFLAATFLGLTSPSSQEKLAGDWQVIEGETRTPLLAWIAERTQGELGDNDAYVRVSKKVEGIFARIDSLLSKEPATAQDLADAMHLEFQIEELRKTGCFRFWAGNFPVGVVWIEDLISRTRTNAMRSPFAKELVLAGAFGDLDALSEQALWVGAFDHKDTSPQDRERLAVYFLEQRRIQDTFWGGFSEHFEEEVGAPNRRRFVALTLDLEEETLHRFFQTMASTQVDRRRNIDNVKELIKIATTFPSTSLRREIRAVIQALRAGSELGNYIDIADNSKPGLLWENKKGELRTLFPSPGQSKRDFVAKARAQGLDIVYISEADWVVEKTPSTKTPRTRERKKAPPKRNVEFLGLWGSVDVLQASEITGFIEQANQRIPIYETAALDILSKTIDLPAASVDHIILPGILPANEPIHALGELGIVAVLRNGNEATFLIKGSPLLAVRGTLDSGNELVFGAGNDDLLYTPAYLLMSAAAVLARVAVAKETKRPGKPLYSSEEERDIYRKVEQWNTGAKPQGLPTLQFGDYNRPGGASVYFPLGKRSLLLNLVATQ